MKLFQLPDLLEGLTHQERLKLICAFGESAKRRFGELLPQLQDWFTNYDAPYLLSFCALYFLSSPEGIDREAIEGKLDFYHHHLVSCLISALIKALNLVQDGIGCSRPQKRFRVPVVML